MNGPVVWIAFNAVLLLLLAIDLVVLRREAHTVKTREALIASGCWIALALLFAGGLWFFEGRSPSLQFLTGYVIEESLSADNLFVILMLFTHFSVPERYQHRVLFWGILGAMVMRLGLIIAGVTLIRTLHFLVFVFGAIVVFAGIQMLRRTEPHIDPKKNFGLRLLRRFMPVSEELDNGHFITRVNGRWNATPLLAALVVIEFADLAFAVDSVPAVLAVSRDPFIVYSSNALAILGLRSLYFALAGVMRAFRHLNVGLAIVLIFVGVKMLISEWIEIPILITLLVIIATLGTAILFSLKEPRKA
ncbi:MAG TPA: TerC family protein [Candidatus Udaeobacter sp.]|nr:TerC family protein [Candidatus Udaeobacter sp.]